MLNFVKNLRKIFKIQPKVSKKAFCELKSCNKIKQMSLNLSKFCYNTPLNSRQNDDKH